MESRLGEVAFPQDIASNIFAVNGIDPFEAMVIANQMETLSYPSDEFALTLFKELLDKSDVIVIVGDLDADGLCATKVAYEYLKRNGYNAKYVISDSASDRGLTVDILRDLLFTRLTDKPKPNVLILTVDCGINSKDAVGFAKSIGYKVVVTDHHNPVEDLVPDCLIFNPRYDGSREELSGSAVIYSLMARLFGENDELVQYAAIGTMTDMVPVLDSNRYIIRRGVEQIIEDAAEPIKAIIDSANINFTTETDIAFYLGPIFNSAHRMGRLSVATSLILEEDLSFASQLVELNQLRKVSAGSLSVEEIADNLEEYDACVILVLGPEYSQIATGPLAATLLNHHLRAAMVISCDTSECKGSIRAPGVIKASLFIANNKDIILEGGGHDAAAGFSCLPENLDEIKRRFSTYALAVFEEHGEDSLLEVKMADFIISPSMIDDACEIIESYRPYGMEFRAPLVAIENITIRNITILKGKHTKITFEEFQYPGMYFFAVLDTNIFVTGTKVDVTCEIVYNTFMGTTKPQLLIRDMVLL